MTLKQWLRNKLDVYTKDQVQDLQSNIFRELKSLETDVLNSLEKSRKAAQERISSGDYAQVIPQAPRIKRSMQSGPDYHCDKCGLHIEQGWEHVVNCLTQGVEVGRIENKIYCLHCKPAYKRVEEHETKSQGTVKRFFGEFECHENGTVKTS